MGSSKELSCGTGPFALVIVRDLQPRYEQRETLAGPADVNVNVFDLKSSLRSARSGGLPVHATNNMQEVEHDLVLLLGLNSEEFAAKYPGTWRGDIILLERNLTGAMGWESLKELFYVLDHTIDYVVLRNFEALPNRYATEEHADIDLLVSDFASATLVTNAEPAYDEKSSVHMLVLVGGQAVPFDFRYIGDGYYDEPWERDILFSRTRSPGGVYVPCIEHHFFSLLYHAAVHKPFVSADYCERLVSLAAEAGYDVPLAVLQGEALVIRQFLSRYLRSKGYRFSVPRDPTVHFNSLVAKSRLERMVGRGRRARGSAIKGRLEAFLPVAELSRLEVDNPARANLLRGFRCFSGKHVLEIHCGAGVVTQLLGEQAARVTAVESDPVLGAMALKRCLGLSGVRVVLGQIEDALTNGPFDYVVVGDIPNEPGALRSTLDLILPQLQQNGEIFLSIANPLGLRYLNGCPEDRSGVPFQSLNVNQPWGCGRRELIALLQSKGLQELSFFYVFPDLYQPGLILKDSALSTGELEVADLLIHQNATGRPETNHRSFAESVAWRSVVRNGLLPDLANAYLVRAGRARREVGEPSWLAVAYSRGRRRPSFGVETRFEHNGAGQLVVRKRSLSGSVEGSADGWLRHVLSDQEYVKGDVLLRQFHQMMAAEEGLTRLADCLKPWFELIKGRAVGELQREGLRLPADHVDCIPANVLVRTDGSVHYFDAEWVAESPVPLAWVVVRGIVNSLIGCLENSAVRGMTYREFIQGLAGAHGISISECEFDIADDYEARLVAECYADAERVPRLHEIIDRPLFMTARLARGSLDYRQSLAWHQAELSRVKSTVSWRITAPLRVIWNTGARIAKGFRVR